MSAVFDAVGDVFEGAVDLVGDVVDVAVDVVGDVVDAAGNVIQRAVDNPVQTIASIAAAATGQAYLIPYINAANTLAQGGDFDDALKSAAISYAAQGAGSYVGGQAGTALEYGTDPFSQQTAMLASQSGDMLGGTTSGTIGGAIGAGTAGATAAALSGGDIDLAITNALGNYFTRTGINYTINAAGELIDQFGNKATDEAISDITNSVRQEYLNQSGTTVNNGDGTYTQTFDDGSTLTTDAYGNAVSSTTYDGDTVYPSSDFGTPSPNLTIKDNGDGTFTQTFDDGSTITTDAQDNVIGFTEATDTGYDFSNVTDAAGKYFGNQFVNALTRQMFGGMGAGAPSMMSRYGPPSLTGRPSTSSLQQTSVGLPGVSGASDFFLSLGVPSSTIPGFTIPDEENKVDTTPINPWNPGISSDWGPKTKLGGLGFAGKFINKEDDSEYINKEEEDRQKLAQEIRNRGWMTDEERLALEQNNLDFNPEESVQMADGGLIDHNPEFYSEGGASLANRFVQGDGDGTSDSVPAMLAKGEFVFPADVVSGLGNGDNEAGAKVLDEFMKTVREHKRSSDPSKLPPDSKGPLSYFKEAQKKVGKKHGRTK